MCVIIYREPGIEIPYPKLASACKVNPTGMGIVTVDRGKLELRKYFWETGNKVDVLAKALEAAKDVHTYVHLRFTTRGLSNRDNVHPFGVLKKKVDGIDMQFMHNGTISDFGNKTDSDTRDFVKSFVSPLARKLSKAMAPEEIIHDPTFLTILKKYAGSHSVFMLMDNFGNHQIINADNGVEFEGWWASNDYSFDRYHRETTKTAPAYSEGYYSSSYGYGKTTYRRDDDEDYKSMYGNQAISEAKEKPTVITLPKLPPSNTTSNTGATGPAFKPDELPWDKNKADTAAFDKAREEAKASAKASNKEVATSSAPSFPDRPTFVEVAGLKQLSDACYLSNLDIEDMVEDYPDKAVILIQDLLKELFDRDNEFEDRAEYDRYVG